MPRHPHPLRISTSRARDRLSALITRVQDPRAFVILTRHDRPVAALVSMAELERIWDQQDIADAIAGTHRPVMFTYGKGTGARTNREAAEAIRQVQMDRLTEREVLKKAGLEPVPGGEVAVEMEAAPPKRRWWARWRRR